MPIPNNPELYTLLQHQIPGRAAAEPAVADRTAASFEMLGSKSAAD
jgi:hypothetical protein